MISCLLLTQTMLQSSIGRINGIPSDANVVLDALNSLTRKVHYFIHGQCLSWNTVVAKFCFSFLVPSPHRIYSKSGATIKAN